MREIVAMILQSSAVPAALLVSDQFLDAGMRWHSANAHITRGLMLPLRHDDGSRRMTSIAMNIDETMAHHSAINDTDMSRSD